MQKRTKREIYVITLKNINKLDENRLTNFFPLLDKQNKDDIKAVFIVEGVPYHPKIFYINEEKRCAIVGCEFLPFSYMLGYAQQLKTWVDETISLFTLMVTQMKNKMEMNLRLRYIEEIQRTMGELQILHNIGATFESKTRF